MTEIQLPRLNFRDYQKPVWDVFIGNKKKRGITVWPRRNGKDLSAINIVAAKALQRKGLYFYIAPFYNQVRQIIWEGIDGTGTKFIDYIPPEIVTRVLNQDMRLYLSNGSQIKLCGSDNIDSIVGTNPLGIIFTEFSLHKPEAWHYLRPILAENGGWALFNGTPRGLNHFYQLYKAALKDPDTWFTQYLTRDDTGIPSLEAIEEDRRSGMPESLIQQEYYCSWTASQEEVLIPLDIVHPAINRPIDPDTIKAFPRVMGVDVAYAAKGDQAVIARRQGPLLLPLDKFQGTDNMALAAHIARRINEWHPRVVFIDAGRGEGVISRLDQMGFNDQVVPVHFGGKVYSELYARKKDEMWCRTKDWFMNPTYPPSIPDDEELVFELSTPEFGLDEKNYIKVETKQHLRSRGVGSTDCADAVILTFAEELQQDFILTEEMRQAGLTEQMLEQLIRNEQQKPYNVLSYMSEYLKSVHSHSDS